MKLIGGVEPVVCASPASRHRPLRCLAPSRRPKARADRGRQPDVETGGDLSRPVEAIGHSGDAAAGRSQPLAGLPTGRSTSLATDRASGCPVSRSSNALAMAQLVRRNPIGIGQPLSTVTSSVRDHIPSIQDSHARLGCEPRLPNKREGRCGAHRAPERRTTVPAASDARRREGER